MKKYLPFLFFLFAFAGCKEKEIEIPATLVTETGIVYYDKTHQYLIEKGDGFDNNRDYQWEVANPKIGTIDANGLFTAKRIGETMVIVKKGTSTVWESLIRITPYSTLYTEPALTFGLGKDAIIKDERRKKVNETETGMLYEGENSKVRNVLYLFQNQKLTSVAALLQNSVDVVSEAATYLKERYTYLGVTKDVYYFEDQDRVSLGLTVDPTLGLTILYLPYTPNKRASFEADGFKSALEKVRAITTSK